MKGGVPGWGDQGMVVVDRPLYVFFPDLTKLFKTSSTNWYLGFLKVSTHPSPAHHSPLPSLSLLHPAYFLSDEMKRRRDFYAAYPLTEGEFVCVLPGLGQCECVALAQA